MLPSRRGVTHSLSRASSVRTSFAFRSLAVAALGTAAAAGATPASASSGEGIAQIDHILVVYLENRSFDGLYGSFPGADGLHSPRGSISFLRHSSN